MISILILTKNEEQNLPGCIESVKWSDDIIVLDSYSQDRTKQLAVIAGAKVVERNFDNWSSHQNWALSNIDFKYPWVLYLDADERVSQSLYNSLKQFRPSNEGPVAFSIRRRDIAWNGSWLKHAQISPFYLRLFRPEKLHYERLVNPVSIPNGSTGKIAGFLDHYPFSKGIINWLQRHLEYADFEARMKLNDIQTGKQFSILTAITNRNSNTRRYHQKGIFYKIPGRPLIKWLYMMFVRLAFLDGRAGITYSTLQAIYEYFIVLKTRELSNIKNKPADKSPF
jgi:glycosyltransferase involved in cell wall biosynthesis